MNKSNDKKDGLRMGVNALTASNLASVSVLFGMTYLENRYLGILNEVTPLLLLIAALMLIILNHKSVNEMLRTDDQAELN